MSAASNIITLPTPAAPPEGAALAVAEALDAPALLSLYAEEDYLLTLAATLDVVPPEQEEELVRVIGAVLGAQVEKRDRVATFFRHLDNQIAFGKEEIERLRMRVGHFEMILDRMEGLLVGVLRKLGRDPKDSKGRRWLKLEGRTATLSLKNLPASAEIDNPAALPAKYQRKLVTVSAELWDRVIDALPMELADELIDAAKVKTDEPPKTPIKEAIERGEVVPGARLDTDRVKLVRA